MVRVKLVAVVWAPERRKKLTRRHGRQHHFSTGPQRLHEVAVELVERIAHPLRITVHVDQHVLPDHTLVEAPASDPGCGTPRSRGGTR